MIACSSSGAPAANDDAGSLATRDAAVDSTLAETADADASRGDADALAPHDAAAVDATKPLGNTDAGACFGGSYEIDGGPDATPDADMCVYLYPCGLNGSGLARDGCQVFLAGPDGGLLPFGQMTCWYAEEAGCDDDAFAPGGDASGGTIYCTPCVGGGRRPAGLRLRERPTGRARTTLATYLASLAFEEDASIVAFERMRAELEALGAPETLAAAAGRAARDEVRHAKTMAKLAKARGGEISPARVRPMRARRAVAVAAENAAEGCVRETYGALVAQWQSLHAEDAELRRAFTRIARDEASHAALSWAVARWLEPQLGAAQRERVARSRSRALRALHASLAAPPPADVVRSAGAPCAEQARALLDAMVRALGLRDSSIAV